MANFLYFAGYSRASGRTPFYRIYVASFSGNAGAANTEVLNFNTAANPNGLEDAQVPNFSSSFAPPVLLGSTVGGYTAELEIGGNGTPGECGITFYESGAPPAALASGSYSAAGFPANAAATALAGSNQFGQVVIGVLDSI
jgi:hypothetical protein